MLNKTFLSQLAKYQSYLPLHLFEQLTTEQSADEVEALHEHVRALHEVLTTYLPRCLVDLINEDPVPGRRILHSRFGTVLFADVSGFTAMSEKLSTLGKEGAEEMTLIVNDYFETMLEISSRYEGDLLKFGGDALVIFFEGEDGPQRALTVATTMQAAMEQYIEVETSQGLFALQMSIGIGSGLIFLVNLGIVDDEMDYAVMGSAMVGMGKAEDVAVAGQIVVDQSTYDVTRQFTTYQALEDDLWLLKSSKPLDENFRMAEGIGQSDLMVDPNPNTDFLQESLIELASVDAISSYVPDELVNRLILDPLRPIQYGSHRPVTVMFANFYGIDDIIDALGQDYLETIHEILNEYFRKMSDIIDRYGGTVSRVDSYVVGHRIMALFGALQAHENDPERAVRAGMEMNHALDGVNQRLVEILNSIPGLDLKMDEEPLKQRIGINTGFVFAGNVGSSNRREFTVMGDQVNLTARLMSVAEAGDVLIGQNTSRHVEMLFELDEKESVQVKGITDPVRNYVVIGESEGSTQRIVSAMSPIVGRDAELEQGKEAIERALHSEGCVLVVNGVSGIGKTRLVDEIVSYGSSAGLDQLVGACLSYGSTLTFHPWVEVLRAYFGIQPTDSSAEKERAVAIGLECIGEGDWTPVMGTVLGLDIPDNDLTRDLDAELRHQRVLDLVVKLLQNRSHSQPLILEIEDAHWADSASKELINYVVRNIAGHAILMILPHRPDDELPDWTSYEHSIEIPLKSLPEDESIEIAQGMLGPLQLPRSTRELIHDRASGNPFFIKEVVHALIEAGAFEKDESGQWQVIEGKEEVDLPDTIHGIVISRVDRLEATHRRILQTASVVGRVFPFQTLAGVYAADEPGVAIRPSLDSLLNVGLIEIQDVVLDSYRFTHLTTQEVVYNTLSFELRRNLHCGIGDYIEVTYADTLSEQIDLLAYHYFEGQTWPKAMEYNLLAGEHAQRAFANDVALTSCRRVLEAASKSSPQIETSDAELTAHEMLGEVLSLIGRYAESLESYTQARVLVDEAPFSLLQLRHRADLCRKTAEVYERWSEYEVAFNWLEKGLDVLREDEPSLEVARIFLLGAGIFHRQGKNEEAIGWCNRSLETASQITSEEGQQALAQAYYLLGAIDYRLGDLRSAVEHCQRSVQLYEGIEDVVGEARAYNNMAVAYTDQGIWDEASDALRKSLEINERIGNIHEQGFVANNLANIYLYRGEWDEAIRLYEQSNAIWKRLGAPRPDAVTLSNLAQVYINQGNLTVAYDLLKRSQDLFFEIGSEDFLPELERRLAEYYLKLGDRDQALSHAQRSLELATAQEARVDLGLTLRVLGDIHISTGEFEQAESSLLRSLQTLDELNSEFEAARTILSLTELGLKDERYQISKAQLEQAIRTFDALNVLGDLERSIALAEKLNDQDR